MKKLLVWYAPTILEKILKTQGTEINTKLKQGDLSGATNQLGENILDVVTTVGGVYGGAKTVFSAAGKAAFGLTSRKLGIKVLVKPNSLPRTNFIEGLKLRTELSFKEAGLLDESGKLTAKALKCVQDRRNLLVRGQDIGNIEVKAALTRNGESLVNWAKYRTESVTLKTGNKANIHFYYNKKTGAVMYEHDFKIKGGLGDKGNDVAIWSHAEGKGAIIKEPNVAPCPKYKL